MLGQLRQELCHCWLAKWWKPDVGSMVSYCSLSVASLLRFYVSPYVADAASLPFCAAMALGSG